MTTTYRSSKLKAKTTIKADFSTASTHRRHQEISSRVRRVALLEKSRAPRMAWIPARQPGRDVVVFRPNGAAYEV
jgi:hypothetical protein